MPDQELNYHLPPDVLHYEPKYLFGLNLQDLLMAVMPALLVLNLVGPIWAVVVALLALAALKRWDGLGDRSALAYLALLAWYRYRPGEVQTMRVLPVKPGRVEVHSWEGERLYVIEAEDRS